MTPIILNNRSATPPIGMAGITDVIKSVKDKATNIVKGKTEDVQQKFSQYQKSVATPGTIPTNTGVTPPISHEGKSAPVQTTAPTKPIQPGTDSIQKPLTYMGAVGHPIAGVASLASWIASAYGIHEHRSKKGEKGWVAPVLLGFLISGGVQFAVGGVVYAFQKGKEV